MKLQTPKGFRDFLPQDALKRHFVMDKITQSFARFGFDPLETPTLEYAETLKGKYGEEEKLIYQFKTAGGDEVALKYDQTVPLARVVAEYGPTGLQKLPLPFKRYQIQSAYRGENTQKGRYREFLQCDADIIGVASPLADTEILALVFEIYKNLGLEVIIKVNDRQNFATLVKRGVFTEEQLIPILQSLDKIEKIGREAVLDELIRKGFPTEQASFVIQSIENLELGPNLTEIFGLLEKYNIPQDVLKFTPTLARGLDYYTGLILEVVLKSNPTSSSLCGGGRWDKMIGKFTGNDLPAIGFAVGFDRTIEAMEEARLLKTAKTQTKVLVTVFSEELLDKSLDVCSRLRSNSISTEVWLDSTSKLEKQLKYADQKAIPYVVIIGPDEAKTNQLTLKDLQNKTQKVISSEELIDKLKSLG